MKQDNYQGLERREFPRVYRNFMVRFKPQRQENSNWEVATINNIGAGGCHFNSDTRYNAGELLDIDIQLPALRELMRFTREIKRCEFGTIKNSSICGLAARFLEIGEERKKVFQEMLKFFLKKQQSS